MNRIILFGLLLTLGTAHAQRTVNVTTAVNASGQSLALSRPSATVNLDYSSLGTGFGIGIVRTNIVNDFDGYVDDMTQYIADNYFKGGTADKRREFAGIIIRGILNGDNSAKLGNQDITWMLSQPLADDLRLFKRVVDRGQAGIYIQDSPDAAIPYRVVSNYPLLLANGQQAPTVVSDTKSIRIK